MFDDDLNQGPGDAGDVVQRGVWLGGPLPGGSQAGGDLGSWPGVVRRAGAAGDLAERGHVVQLDGHGPPHPAAGWSERVEVDVGAGQAYRIGLDEWPMRYGGRVDQPGERGQPVAVQPPSGFLVVSGVVHLADHHCWNLVEGTYGPLAQSLAAA